MNSTLTDPGVGGQCSGVGTSSGSGPGRARVERRGSARARTRPSLAAVYREQLDFVDRCARHLRVPAAHVDDVVHDVFLVVHRRLPDFDPTSGATLRSWLYGITRRVVMHHQRSARRMHARHARFSAARELSGVSAPSPAAALERDEAARAVQRFLDSLDDDKRQVFALIEIEGFSAPEAARALGVKLNTVYSRLRAARQRFELAVAAHSDAPTRRDASPRPPPSPTTNQPRTRGTGATHAAARG
ncbi:MAG: sigma-70 family RNA polymerase sigma factor [Myxococcales bacterium]|nr:sigma-70 family RNA polymerase sigma factor [Myxococcales bacterium]